MHWNWIWWSWCKGILTFYRILQRMHNSETNRSSYQRRYVTRRCFQWGLPIFLDLIFLSGYVVLEVPSLHFLTRFSLDLVLGTERKAVKQYLDFCVTVELTAQNLEQALVNQRFSKRVKELNKNASFSAYNVESVKRFSNRISCIPEVFLLLLLFFQR